MQPAHIRFAALGSRPPGMIHGRDAVDGVRLAAHAHLADEMTGLIEMAGVGRAPGECAGRAASGTHRIQGRVMNIERHHQRGVGNVDDRALAIVVAYGPLAIRLRADDVQRVGQVVVEQTAWRRYRQGRAIVAKIGAPRRQCALRIDANGRADDAEVGTKQRVDADIQMGFGVVETKEIGFRPIELSGAGGVKFGVAIIEHG